MKPEVTVVIPHYNRRDLLVRLLHSCQAQSRPFDRILVADNGSDDGSLEAAQENGAEVLSLGRNYGFAYAVNRGIERSAGSHIAILNNDVVLDPGWLQYLLDAGAAFACGKIFDEADPSRLDGTFDLLSRGGIAWRAGNARAADHPDWNSSREIQFAPLTAALFRRDVFDSVGLLDESFGSYLEDIDLGLRCGYRGITGRYVPRATATHLGSATLGAWRPETVRLLSRNQVLLLAKHYPAQWMRKYGCCALAGQLLWGVAALRRGQGAAWWKGKWEGISAFRKRTPSDHPELDEILSSSERDLVALQFRHQPDRLWKVYSWLT